MDIEGGGVVNKRSSDVGVLLHQLRVSTLHSPELMSVLGCGESSLAIVVEFPSQHDSSAGATDTT